MILNGIKQITMHFVTSIFTKPKTKVWNINSMYVLTIRLRRQQRMRWLDGITNLMGRSLSKLWETVKARATCCAALHGVTNSQS